MRVALLLDRYLKTESHVGFVLSQTMIPILYAQNSKKNRMFTYRSVVGTGAPAYRSFCLYVYRQF